jgi:hypothetical protein
MDIISYDNLNIILSYLYVSEYKYINKYLYLKANENASNIIKKYVRRYRKESNYIEKTLYNMITLNKNRSTSEYNIILKYIKLDLKKNWCINKRNMKTVNIVVYNAEVKFQLHFTDIIERNIVQINHDFIRNYILNSEAAEAESKLIDLSIFISRRNNKYLKQIQLKFINNFYKDFLNISKSILYLENKIKKLVVESIPLKYRELKYLTPFKDFMYKFVIYDVIKHMLNEMTIIYTDKLYDIYQKDGFNNLIDSIEIDLYEYFSILY